MKKLFFIVGLLSLLTFFSCQNEENVYYSCDEAEDAWVKENLSSIRKMETTEWFSISEKLKLPVYRAFSLEQKQSVWMEKLEDVMMNNEWKTEEIGLHLLKKNWDGLMICFLLLLGLQIELKL